MKIEIDLPKKIVIILEFLEKIGFGKNISGIILNAINLLLEKYREYFNDFDSYKKLRKELE